VKNRSESGREYLADALTSVSGKSRKVQRAKDLVQLARSSPLARPCGVRRRTYQSA
jgi:hypothetical protein